MIFFLNIQNSLPHPEVPDVVVGAVVIEVVVVGVAEVGKGFSGFNFKQLFCPQVRPSSHSSLISQSPSCLRIIWITSYFQEQSAESMISKS